MGSDILATFRFDVVDGASVEDGDVFFETDLMQYMTWAVGAGANALQLEDGASSAYVPAGYMPGTGDDDSANAGNNAGTGNAGNNDNAGNNASADNAGNDNANIADDAGNDDAAAESYILTTPADVEASTPASEAADSMSVPTLDDAADAQLNVNEVPQLDEVGGAQLLAGQNQHQAQGGTQTHILLWAGLAALALLVLARVVVTRVASKRNND